MKKLFLLATLSGSVISLPAQNTKLDLRVDAGNIIHQMKGGLGASWHALIKDIPLDNEKYDYPVRHINPRGSAYAGNPPLGDTATWGQLYQHAKWLGLDFVRVELSQHMYEPGRNIFDWKNDEMQALYRILDWCEANHADVFLQQMWGHVAWNAHPGVHPLLSAPKSVDDFANGIATLLKYLTETKKYTCIKYFCMTNEPPGGPWGYWWSGGSHTPATITDAWKKLQETFTKQGIKIPLSGPDWVSLPPCEPAKIDFDQYLGAFDIHSYFGLYNKNNGEQVIGDWVKYARTKNKPFFLTEFGNMDLGWGADNQGPKTFKAALSNASDVALCMNLGVDGFNRWSFTNRGDMDGQWQLVKTYDLPTKTYSKEVTTENEAYYGFAMLSRFMGKYASVLSVKMDPQPEGIVATAYKNSDGQLSILMVNNRKEAVTVNVTVDNGSKKQAFYFYEVTETLLKGDNFQLNPVKNYKDEGKLKNMLLQPESISIVTTNVLNNGDLGVIE
ncbi:MAG: cellulase family glycosylhydrolase [Ferruginibacter sp.]|nr:cellulase family glycosylhydrolase [Ferruginibacter sp.]